jgi:hypothetical protein
VHGQAADEVDGVLVGADLGWRRRSGTVRSLIAPPFQRSIRAAFGAGSSRCSVMFTSSIRVRSSCLRSLSVVVGASHTWLRFVAERQDRRPLAVGEGLGPGGLAAGQLGLGVGELAERVFPLGFQAAGDQPVVGVDGAVAALGPGGVVAGLLGLAAVLVQRRVVAVLDLLGGLQAGAQRHRLESGQECPGDGGVDALPADAHVPGATAVDQLGGAVAVVVRHASGRAGVEDRQLAAACAAGRQALQQRAAFPDRAGARLAGLRADVGADAGLVGLVGVPVGEPGVVIGDEDLPLVAGQPAAALAQRAAGSR